MAKKLLFISISAALILITLFTLSGCQSYKNDIFSMGDKDAVVESNGGLVVKQGGYIYFVNGYSGYYTENSRDNWFGNVVKGAIMRVKASAPEAKGEIIVPKSVMSGYTDSGFSIYGDFIYYVSPGSDEDKSGNVNTGLIQFMRTRLDGQETRVIYQSESTSLKYKYTPTGLAYYNGEKLYFKSYDSKHFKADEEGTVIAEDVVSVFFPRSNSYDRKTGETAADYFFYTKASEDMYDYSNVVYIANASGSVNKKIIDKYTYTENPAANSDLAYNIGLVNAAEENGGLTLYYTKTQYTGTQSSGDVIGLYCNKIGEGQSFDKDAERRLSRNSVTKLYPLGYDNGMIVYDAALSVYGAAGELTVISGITSVTVAGVLDGYVYYYDAQNIFFRYKLDGSQNVEKLMTDAAHTSFLTPEIFGGYLYFFNSAKYNYLYRADLSTYDRADAEALSVALVGYMTDADAEALKEAEKE